MYKDAHSTYSNVHVLWCTSTNEAPEDPRGNMPVVYHPGKYRYATLCNFKPLLYVKFQSFRGASSSADSTEGGQIELFKLTKNNIRSLHEDIPIEELCKTFREALIVTRYLDLDYLWIDSLCIIQDDPEDVSSLWILFLDFEWEVAVSLFIRRTSTNRS